MRRVAAIISVVLGILVATGCASSQTGKSYTRDQARKTHTVQTGTIQKIEAVKIEGTKSPVGVIAGAACRITVVHRDQFEMRRGSDQSIN